ncbi:DUF4919 domain-containing protein [Chryseobacterium luteum]|uniref:Uncharacterized protein n=1 Tax=Chryseobacterium luteum TaxID=421531 RepID=A0A085ZB68_9FLAO|nr:DUF4919 domain-containing protein [Chryseobacterium luteum]KFF01682.1 hypothetical protein IX38_16570 [Chryseobacterium luteum]
MTNTETPHRGKGYFKAKTNNILQMTKNYCLTFFIVLLFNFSFGQTPPLPPAPKEAGNYSSKDNSRKEMIRPIEISVNNEKKEAIPQNNIPKFNISIDQSMDKNSIYYFKNIEEQIAKLDTLLSGEQIISLTKYKIHTKAIHPAYLDSLANKAYLLNENKNYRAAIEVSEKILTRSPNNITAHKEMAYAYKRLDDPKRSNLHFSMMVKIIKSVFKYGDGSRQSPYILNNFFEGLSIYEAMYSCFPKKVTLILTTDKNLLGGYDCFHIMRFSNLNHWLPSLSEEDYKVEQ